MLRSQKGIELFVNLINITYSAMKILPYEDSLFSDFKRESVQEFRFILSQKIREQIFYAHLVKNIESAIKSNAIKNALKQWIQKQCELL